MPVCLERTATTFLEALHESEGRRSCLKHCQLRRAAIERSLMEQAETLVHLLSYPFSPQTALAQLGARDDTEPAAHAFSACATGPVQPQ
jgi:hypothetical protein